MRNVCGTSSVVDPEFHKLRLNAVLLLNSEVIGRNSEASQILIILLLRKYLFYVTCMNVFIAYMSVHHAHVWCP